MLELRPRALEGWQALYSCAVSPALSFLRQSLMKFKLSTLNLLPPFPSSGLQCEPLSPAIVFNCMFLLNNSRCCMSAYLV
ncbi:mCG148365 [Mus musculus]|nr:mCG148365 [Mus musculus]